MNIDGLHLTETLLQLSDFILHLFDLLVIYSIKLLFLFILWRGAGSGQYAPADAKLPLRFYPSHMGLGVDQLVDRLLLLLSVSHHELPEAALLIKQLEIESLDSTHQL